MAYLNQNQPLIFCSFQFVFNLLIPAKKHYQTEGLSSHSAPQNWVTRDVSPSVCLSVRLSVCPSVRPRPIGSQTTNAVGLNLEPHESP